MSVYLSNTSSIINEITKWYKTKYFIMCKRDLNVKMRKKMLKYVGVSV